MINTAQTEAVRRRLIESVHGDWIETVQRKTGWPREDVIDVTIAANCDRQRLHDAYEQFTQHDNLNPFTSPSPSQRFLQFVRDLGFNR